MWHSLQGQEAVEAGAFSFLRKDDITAISHRGHGLGPVLCKNADLKGLFAESYGKATGQTLGMTGWHVCDPENGFLGYCGLLGLCFSLSIGWGLAAKKNNTGQVVMCTFGDGTTGRGTFQESMNMASLWKLPIVYLCANNGMGVFMPIEDAYPKADIADMGAAFDIPSVVVDGQDPIAVHEAVQTAVERGRSGQGPTLIEAKTCRFLDHGTNLPMIRHATFIPKEETESMIQNRDPIKLFREELTKRKVLNAAEIKRIDDMAYAEVKELHKYASESPLPDPKILEEFLYTERGAIR